MMRELGSATKKLQDLPNSISDAYNLFGGDRSHHPSSSDRLKPKSDLMVNINFEFASGKTQNCNKYEMTVLQKMLLSIYRQRSSVEIYVHVMRR